MSENELFEDLDNNDSDIMTDLKCLNVSNDKKNGLEELR